MNILNLLGLLVAMLLIPTPQGSNLGGHPQKRFCWADFVIRVKILGKIKTDKGAPSSDFLVDSQKTQPSERNSAELSSIVNESSGDEPSLRQLEETMTEILHKESDLPPTEDTMDDSSFKSTSSLLDAIFRRRKRSLGIGLRGAPLLLKGNFHEPQPIKRVDENMDYYDVLIKKIFKGRDKLRNINGAFVDAANPKRLFAKVYVASYVAQDLEPYAAYMLSGKIMQNNLVIATNACWFEKWQDLSKDQIRGLHGKYAQNCDCNITPCFPCKGVPPAATECLWNVLGDCAIRHGTCVKHNNECIWTKGQGFDSCSSQQSFL